MAKGNGTSSGSAAAGLGLSAILGPLGGLAGNVIGGLFGRSGQDEANRTNLQIARENREFQERMSSTAYQRSAADLEKAGLNRILALGKPSSTPAGNIATMQNKNAQLSEGIRSGVSSALQARKLAQEIKESDSRIVLQGKQGDALGIPSTAGSVVEQIATESGLIGPKPNRTGEAIQKGWEWAKATLDRIGKKTDTRAEVLGNALAQAVSQMDTPPGVKTREQQIEWGLKNIEAVQRFKQRQQRNQ